MSEKKVMIAKLTRSKKRRLRKKVQGQKKMIAPARAIRRPPKHFKQKQRRQAPRVVVANAPSSTMRNTLSINTEFDNNAVNLAYASVYGFMASRGIFNEASDSGNDGFQAALGLTYLFADLVKVAQGQVIGVARAPRFMLELMDALASKQIPFLTFAKVLYSWKSVVDFVSTVQIPSPGGLWKQTYVQIGSGASYDTPASFLPGPGFGIEDYAVFLQLAASMSTTPAFQIEEVTKYNSILKNDASAFARSYCYNGIQPSVAGGYYRDVENEVNITAPLMSCFATYGDDVRVPTKLTAYSGDAALAAGWPLHPTFTSYFNKRPPAFKVLDFEWFYATLVQWMCYAIPKAVNLGSWSLGETLPMTMQDFRVVLRQALLNVFDTQYMVQFTGPVNFGVSENGFAPFMISGNSYGNPKFSQFLLPVLLKENINALRARALQGMKKGSSKLNVMNYIPVLGRYVNDTPVIPQYIVESTPYPLFQVTPQQTINLIDGSINPNVYVDLNNIYYQTMMQNWNFSIGSVKEVISSTSNIVGDSGPLGMGCLYYTSVQTHFDESVRSVYPKITAYAKYAQTISNLPKAATRQGSDRDLKKPKNIESIPPATLVTLTQIDATTNFPISPELNTFLDTVIVPSVRLDPNGTTDKLSLQMYQTEVKEPISGKYTEGSNFLGGGTWARLGKYAQLMITGVGHETGGEYDTIMNQLAQHNQAGFLSGLLGGLAKTFLPADAHGVIDTVADILPF